MVMIDDGWIADHSSHYLIIRQSLQSHDRKRHICNRFLVFNLQRQLMRFNDAMRNTSDARYQICLCLYLVYATAKHSIDYWQRTIIKISFIFDFSGISSTVRRCIEKETGREFAAKIIDLGADSGDVSSSQMLEATRQEIAILRQVMGHPYISELLLLFNPTKIKLFIT